jgi:hypothetical protein
MTADQERAFDAQSAATSRALWPGQIRMAGVTYDVALTRGFIRVQIMDGDANGVREVSGVSVELDKCAHPTEPVHGTIFADLGDGSRLYKILRVGGRGDNDTVWLIEGAVEE